MNENYKINAFPVDEITNGRLSITTIKL